MWKLKKFTGKTGNVSPLPMEASLVRSGTSSGGRTVPVLTPGRDGILKHHTELLKSHGVKISLQVDFNAD